MRADGIRLKGTNPMYTVAAYFMTKRYDSMNNITINIPQEPIKAYCNQCRAQGRPTSHLAVVLAAYVRTLTQFPELNRFVVNKKFYARTEIAVGMVVLKSKTNGTMNKVKFAFDDNIDEVTAKINEYVAENSVPEDETNSTDKVINILLHIPGLLAVGIPILKWADRHGLLPKGIIDASPFHTSLVITNLASIKTNYIHHHCYDFGTTSIVLAMGNAVEVPHRRKGEMCFEKCIPMGVVMDERVASGAYFAFAFKYFEKLLENPEVLEHKPTADEIKIDPNVPEKKWKAKTSKQ